MIDHVGEKFEFLHRNEFMMAWISLFSHSPKNRMLWRDKSMKSLSATQWWSRWEVMDQVLTQFGDVETSLRKEDLGSSDTTAKLLGILTYQTKRVLLEVELAAVVDYGRPFVTTTYKLEGDGPLVLVCYELIESLQVAIRSGYAPNVDAVVRKLCVSTPHLLCSQAAWQ